MMPYVRVFGSRKLTTSLQKEGKMAKADDKSALWPGPTLSVITYEKDWGAGRVREGVTHGFTTVNE
jgi:hypothetical protein